MRNGIIVCRLSLIKTCLLAYHVLRKFRDSASLIKGDQMPTDTRGEEGGSACMCVCVCVCWGGGGGE